MPVVQSNSQNGWFATNDDELVHINRGAAQKSKFGRSPLSILRNFDVFRWKTKESSYLENST